MEENPNKQNHSSQHAILIVEDNFVTQFSLKEMLEKLELKADFVSTGEEAVELYAHHQLILMDIDLPGITGIEASQKIRALEKKQKASNPAHIIATTSHSDEPKMQEDCLAAGINEVSGKLTLNLLKNFVQKHTKLLQSK